MRFRCKHYMLKIFKLRHYISNSGKRDFNRAGFKWSAVMYRARTYFKWSAVVSVATSERSAVTFRARGYFNHSLKVAE